MNLAVCGMKDREVTGRDEVIELCGNIRRASEQVFFQNYGQIDFNL